MKHALNWRIALASGTLLGAGFGALALTGFEAGADVPDSVELDRSAPRPSSPGSPIRFGGSTSGNPAPLVTTTVPVTTVAPVTVPVAPVTVAPAPVDTLPLTSVGSPDATVARAPEPTPAPAPAPEPAPVLDSPASPMSAASPVSPASPASPGSADS